MMVAAVSVLRGFVRPAYRCGRGRLVLGVFIVAVTGFALAAPVVAVTARVFPTVVIGAASAATLSPATLAADAAGGATVINPGNAGDNDVLTYAAVAANADQYGTVIASGFPADAEPASRAAVVVRVNLAALGMSATGVPDLARVFFRARAVDPFLAVATYHTADLTAVVTWYEIDVTAAAGSNPSTGFEVAAMFSNSVAGDPPDPA